MIDPNVFVSPPYLQCPECGKSGFGVLSINADSVIRRCTDCQFKGKRALPSVRKSIVFLDQFVFSNMIRVTHPAFGRDGPHAEFYRRLMVALDRLVHLQAVVCPEASTHEEESALDRRLEDAVRRVIRHYSGGVRFAHRKSIEVIQATGTALAWHLGRDFVLDAHHTRRVLLGDPHSWLPELDLVVKTPWSDEEVAVLRSIRDGTIRDWAPVFERWRQKPLTFMERVREEGKGYGQSVLMLSAERDQRIAEMRAGQRPVDPNDIDARRHETARHVLAALVAIGMDLLTGAERTKEFFRSEAVLSIPFNRLRPMLLASLSQETQNGRKGPTNRDLGTPADFAAISTSLPYCDAMFVDNKCAQYLSQGSLADEVQKYGCRVFSLNTREQFLCYLAELEAAVPASQRELALETYGALTTEPPQLFSGETEGTAES